MSYYITETWTDLTIIDVSSLIKKKFPTLLFLTSPDEKDAFWERNKGFAPNPNRPDYFIQYDKYTILIIQDQETEPPSWLPSNWSLSIKYPSEPICGTYQGR